jgi:hypothetical protein
VRQFVYHKQELVAEIGEEPEKFKGVPKTVAYSLQPLFKDRFGRALLFLGKDIEKITAPEFKAPAKPGAVPGDPDFFALGLFAYQEEMRGGLVYGLDDPGLLRFAEGTHMTTDNAQPGEGLAYVLFGLLEDGVPASQEIHRQFPFFQNSKQADNEIKGHVPVWGFPGEEQGARDKALGNGNYEGGIEDITAVFVVSPGPEQIPKRKQDNGFTVFRARQEIVDDIRKILRMDYIQRNL